MAINYKELLNPEQYEVVSKADGYSLVLAGAGSGKTRTITYRVAYLLENNLAKPEEILLMTFTNKAAKEMLNRVNELLGNEFNIQGGTFHRMGNLFLRQYIYLLGYTPSFTILDQDDSQQLLKVCLKELGYKIKRDGLPQLGAIKQLISYAQNTQLPFRQVLKLYEYTFGVEEKLTKIAEKYKKEKQRLNQVDFDDLLYLWLKILQKYPKVLKEISSKYKYILVDEYQDVNAIQAELVKKLGQENKNILVVGDDAQSIYSFRAADVDNILSFPKNFSGAKIFKLEKNYRSSPEILALAQESILCNQIQYEKKLEAINKEGFSPVVYTMQNMKAQAKFIAERIQELNIDGKSFKNMAILSRSMYQTIDIQLALSNHNIPYVIRGGKRYFEQAHIKDILSFLKVLHNFKDEVAWRRLLLMFPGIGSGYASKIIKSISEHNDWTSLLKADCAVGSAKAKKAWAQILDIFKDIYKFFIQEDTVDVVKVLEYVYKNFYVEYLKDNYDKFDERSSSLEQFIDFAVGYKNLEKLLTDITLDEEHFQKKKQNRYDDDAVVLSTIHQAKGLEWDVVFIVNLYQGAFPHYKSVDSNQELQEERRLFYVAVTRAKEELFLLVPEYSMHYAYGQMRNQWSVFLEEIDDDLYDEMTFM